MIKKILIVLLACYATAWSAPVLDLDFTASEGFSDNADLNGIQGMTSQGTWDAGDTAGLGYATSIGDWQRAKNNATFTLDAGHSVVIEATLRLTDADGTYSDADNFQIGFAESSLHAGNSIPAIGAILHTYSDGSYWFGGSSSASRINVGVDDAGDWIKFTQTITRSETASNFTCTVTASNETSGIDLGETSSWTESTSDGSWGGTMCPSFRTLQNAQATAMEIDRWVVYTTTNGAPPVVTNPSPPGVTNAPLHILIDPEVSASIDGHLELDRQQFITLADTGKTMESKVDDAPQVDYYINDLDMHFGRELGGAYGVVGWNQQAVVEDTSRTGYVNMTNLENKLNPNNGGSSSSFINHFSPNLNVATHDRFGSIPSFMPTWYADGDDPGHTFATNADAYAEFVAGVLEHGYTDWTRPATYEIVNEPNWRTWGDQRFADIHTEVKAKVDAAGLDVAVGGPCMSVGYFYKNNYQAFNMKDFINNTGCNLDFYSFHVYDYMAWDAAQTDFVGRVSTGLPVEGVLDLVQSYTHNTYGKGVDMVLSEHGGYISTDQELALDTVANTYFPGSGFEWELKRRSVSECLAVRSAIANTMAFMNNPHVVRKSVPFILLESASWNPSYYSTLLVKENFNQGSSVWYESTYINFFKYFKNVSGRRIRLLNDDPDIQSQAYVDNDRLYILLNNLAETIQPLELNLPEDGIQSITVRRFGRNGDFTPFFIEGTVSSLDGLMIGSREALAIEVEYASAPQEKLVVDEVPHYSNLYQQQFSGSRNFSLSVADVGTAKSALLRIGVGRGTGTDQDMQILFNGTELDVPMEDCADYLENSSEYGSTKLVSVPVELLQAANTVRVTFPSGFGGIGAVTLRVAHEQSSSGPVYSQWVLDQGLSISNAVRTLDFDGDGFDNFTEFVCGTDPDDNTDYLRSIGAVDAPDYKVLIDSRSGRFYAVETTDDLTSGWIDLTNGVVGTGSLLEIVDPDEQAERFYRVRAEIE